MYLKCSLIRLHQHCSFTVKLSTDKTSLHFVDQRHIFLSIISFLFPTSCRFTAVTRTHTDTNRSPSGTHPSRPSSSWCGRCGLWAGCGPASRWADPGWRGVSAAARWEGAGCNSSPGNPQWSWRTSSTYWVDVKCEVWSLFVNMRDAFDIDIEDIG